ncbi:annexin-like protein RJ4 [Carica papaya]|uniref:annexin-like protein RJ4 n=1 Tax=Carica papaya TaxID=3649 RepID=UPI000B8CB55F|nr:annexin-like protein RJ4 [Carica papaya]
MASLIVHAQASAVEDAEALRKAFAGLGTNEKAIISILGHRNAAQRKQIRVEYELLYKEDFLSRLESELTRDFKRAVYLWMLEPADRDAVFVHEAIKKHKIEYQVLIEISCTRSPEELFAIRRAYQVRYKLSLEEDVACHTSGDIRKLLIALLTTFRYNGNEINDKLASSEADILRDAIKDKVYNHDEVVRIISTRSKAQLSATFNCHKEKQGAFISEELLGDLHNDLAVMLYGAILCLIDPKEYFEWVLHKSMQGIGTDEDALTRVIITRAEKDLLYIKELYHKKNGKLLAHDVAGDTSRHYKHFLLTLLGDEK